MSANHHGARLCWRKMETKLQKYAGDYAALFTKGKRMSKIFMEIERGSSSGKI